MNQDWKLTSPKYSFAILFFSLVGFLSIHPIIPNHFWASLSMQILFSLVLLVTVYSLSNHRVLFFIGILLAIPSIGLLWDYVYYPSHWLELTAAIASMFFLLFATIILGHRVFYARRVEANMIFGAVSLYLMLGIFCGVLYGVIDMVVPHSFAGDYHSVPGALPLVKHATKQENLIYFSFVTLTTLGYGDIIPVSDIARSVSSMQAVLGQMYIATILARIVAMFTRAENGKQKEKRL